MKLFLKLFMILWTALILAYASTFVVFEKKQIRALHENIPPLQYVGVMLGVFDDGYLDDKTYSVKKRIQKNLREYINWKQTTVEIPSWAKTSLIVTNYDPEIRLYSPTHTFKGTVSKTVQEMRITLSHKGRELVKTIPVKRRSDGKRTAEVSLANDMMFPGENTYLIEALYEGGLTDSKRVNIVSDFQRVEIGETVLYVDPHYIPDGQVEDIIRTALDLQENEANFITWGCDANEKQPSLLIEHDVQFKEIPACVTFSLVKDYMLRFEPAGVEEGQYMYSLHTPSRGRMYDAYPLYRKHLGQVYYSLLFLDEEENRLETIYAHGTSSHYTMRIERHNLNSGKIELQIVVTDGNQLTVENERQKMYTYMYKQRDRTTGLSFPGHRYQYFLKGYGGSRGKINEGLLYSLPVGVLAPRKDFDSTFGFRITLDGNILYIDDSIKITQFDVTAMGTTIDVKDRPQDLNAPGVCDGIRTEIYKNLLGDESLGISSRDYPYIVGEGWHVSSMKIFHNGKSYGTAPDQLFKGYVHHRLGKERGNFGYGENTYVVKGYDEWGNELCSVRLELFGE